MEENQVTIKILSQPKPHFMLNSGLYGKTHSGVEDGLVPPKNVLKNDLIMVQAILATTVAKRNIYINSKRTKTKGKGSYQTRPI